MSSLGNGHSKSLRDLVALADSGTWGEEGRADVDSPVLRSSDIQGDRLSFSDAAWRVIPDADRQRRRMATGDILVTKSSGSADHIGKCALFEQPDDDRGYYFSNFMLRLRAQPTRADPRWLFYWLTSKHGRAVLESMNSTTSGLRNLSVTRYLDQHVPLPYPDDPKRSLAEQKRIAAILDKADAIRRRRHEAARLTEQLIPSLFYDMFGDPIGNGRNFSTRPFGDLASNEDGRRLPVKASDRAGRQGKYPYYGASGIIDYVNDYIFEGRSLLIAEDGANLLARSTPIAFIADGQYWVNNHAHVVTYNGEAELDYLAAHLNLRLLRDFVTGSAQPKLTQANLNRIRVPYPPLPLQQEFSTRLGAIRAMQIGQDEITSKADDMFNSLVQLAFRGEL